MMKTLTAAIVVLALVAACASSSRNRWVDPSFSGKAVRDGATAFLILPPPTEIPATGLSIPATHFPSAFSPEPIAVTGVEGAQLLAGLRASLPEYLTGRTLSDDGFRDPALHLSNLTEVVDSILSQQIADVIAEVADSVRCEAIPLAPDLDEILAIHNLDHVILLGNMTLRRSAEWTPGGVYRLPDGSSGYTPPGELIQSKLECRAIVWSRIAARIVWDGTVHTSTFDTNIDLIARSLARSLYYSMK